MSKSLVTIIGLVVSLGVIALGFFLVALPAFFQATSVDAQTATVAGTNTIYQAQVESLRAEEENLPEITASVDGLRAQIPATGQYDDVFEVIGSAADASGVLVTSITAGESVPFALRTAALADGETPAAPAAEPTPAPTESAGTTDTTGTQPETPIVASDTRQQVDFVIQATAADMNQVTAFLDSLRAGPRLLQSMQAVTTQSGGGEITIQITALTYVDAEEG